MSSPLSSGPRVASSGSGIVILRCSSAQIQALCGTGRGSRSKTELSMAAGSRTQGACLPAPIDAQAPFSPGSLAPPWAVDRSCASLPGSLPLS